MFLTVGLTASSFAIPNMQVYIPGATYNEISDSWVTSETDFELWLIVANLDDNDIYDVHLVASILGDEAPKDGGLTITPLGGSPTTYNAADFAYGSPPITDPISAHGIYPANYIAHFVTAVTEQNPDNWYRVDDYKPGKGSDPYGQIFKFQVHTEYMGTHFDAYGFNEDGRRVSAHGSHDAESVVPEPATSLLFTLGLVGAGIIRNFGKKQTDRARCQ